MKNEFIFILVFFVTLFTYIHVIFHLKTSDDLEIYEIDSPSKNKLEEICDLRQPVIFNYENSDINNNINLIEINKNYSAFDVNVYDDKSPTQLNFEKTLELLKKDKEHKFICEKNQDFLKETCLDKIFTYSDKLLRPYMVSNYNYDIVMAANQYQTKFKYDLNYRNYYMVTQGKLKIKLSPPKSKKYLSMEENYDTFEFTSPVNPWNVDPKYTNDFNKIKCLELELTPNKILYIPAYWLYSFEFTEDTMLCVYKYKTYMNSIAMLPQTILHFLQTQNIKHEYIGKLNKFT